MQYAFSWDEYTGEKDNIISIMNERAQFEQRQHDMDAALMRELDAEFGQRVCTVHAWGLRDG